MFAIVIPIGGDGTRVSYLTKGRAKPELKIYKKKKIIDFQIDKVSGLKKKIILLSRIKFRKLNSYILKKYKNLDIEIITEKEKLGTAGCLYPLRKLNYKFYLMIYGDLIFNIDFKKLIKFHKKKKADCTLVVHPNNHAIDSDCIEIDKNFKSKKIFLKPHFKKYIPNLCLAGINVINKKTLFLIKKNKSQDFSKDFLKLNEKKIKIFGYNTREYIKDAGTPERINEIKKDLIGFKFKNGNINKKIPAIFLDKDGVINKLNKKKHYQKIDKIIKGTINSLKIINKSGFLTILVTNQPAIAKGIISEKRFLRDINKLSYLLSKNKVYIDRVYYCPHHPEKGYKSEIKGLKINCKCRKPNNGLFLNAIKDLNINKKKSYVIGDQISDYLAAKKTNLNFIGVNNSKLFKKEKILNKKSLYSAIKYIFKKKI